MKKTRKAFIKDNEWHLLLTQGYTTIIDEKCVKWAEEKNWHVSLPQNKNHTRYVKGHKHLGKHRNTVSYFHRELYEKFIGDIPEGMQVDHIDHNTLNNRLSNLRLATHGQNGKNRSAATNKSSKYLGIYWNKKEKRWHAQIGPGNRNLHLGYFTNEDDAAKAYDDAARKHYGEYANTNF